MGIIAKQIIANHQTRYTAYIGTNCKNNAHSKKKILTKTQPNRNINEYQIICINKRYIQ